MAGSGANSGIVGNDPGPWDADRYYEYLRSIGFDSPRAHNYVEETNQSLQAAGPSHHPILQWETYPLQSDVLAQVAEEWTTFPADFVGVEVSWPDQPRISLLRLRFGQQSTLETEHGQPVRAVESAWGTHIVRLAAGFEEMELSSDSDRIDSTADARQ